jgi:hypothetical protein
VVGGVGRCSVKVWWVGLVSGVLGVVRGVGRCSVKVWCLGLLGVVSRCGAWGW